jgi:hypothetical protein
VVSTSEQPKNETKRGPEEGNALRAVGQPSGEGRETPLFLRGRSDGHKGNDQDEKDEVGE